MAAHQTFRVECPDCKCSHEIIKKNKPFRFVLCEDCAYKRTTLNRKSYSKRKD